MELAFDTSSHVSSVGYDDFSRRMTIIPCGADQIDAILYQINHSDILRQKAITAQRVQGGEGAPEHILVALHGDTARPHDVLDVLMQSGMVEGTEAGIAKSNINTVLAVRTSMRSVSGAAASAR